MELWSYTGISLNGTQGDHSDPAFVGARQRGATLSAKTPSSTRWRFVDFYKVFSQDPFKIIRLEIRVSGKGGTVLSPAHGTVAVVRI